MINHKTMMLVGICTIIIATAPTVFADNYGVDLLNINHNKLSNHEIITVQIKAIIPIDDFVTAKLINSDGETAHKIWYKLKSDSLTTFSHTFTDIEKLSKRGTYTIVVEYGDMIDQKTITLI